IRSLLFALSILLRIQYCDADGFVEEVACSSDGVTVMLNRSDPELAQLMNDPNALPVVYVYGHKERVQCGTSLKSKAGGVNYNLTIGYGKVCDVYLTNLEPHYRTSEMAIVLENNSNKLGKQILNQVHCVYNKQVQTYKFSEVSNTQPIAASTGGRPNPKVDMHFRNIDGKPLREARVGELLEFYLSIVPDNTYKAILPKECMFSDREDLQSPQTQRITFVQNSCPNHAFSEIIDPIAHVNQEVFFSKFKTFRFDNQTTVFVHCTAQVCMSKEECATKCFKRITNSDLTGQRLRFRHKRSIGNDLEPHVTQDKDGDVEMRSQLRVYTEKDIEKVIAAPSTGLGTVTECSSPLLGLSSTHIFVFTAFLLAVAIASLIIIVYLLHRLKRKTKESTFELYSAAQLRSMANSSANLVDRYPGYPLHVNTGFH
ncbi:hypothetical protein PFISCL1PPCAC_24840, partial [Pristionchus fissidentatus]